LNGSPSIDDSAASVRQNAKHRHAKKFLQPKMTVQKQWAQKVSPNSPFSKSPPAHDDIHFEDRTSRGVLTQIVDDVQPSHLCTMKEYHKHCPKDNIKQNLDDQ
jgi:hypothetical protein